MEIIRPGSIKIDTCTYQLHGDYFKILQFITTYHNKLQQ